MIFQDKQLKIVAAEIIDKSISRKLGENAIFKTNPEENAFFMELVKQVKEARLNPYSLYFEPMSNKSFSVHYRSYPIGKIKLNGRKSFMQVLKGLYGVKELSDLSLKEYMSYIPEWIKYINYCLRD